MNKDETIEIKRKLLETLGRHERYIVAIEDMADKKFPNWKKDWSIHLKRQEYIELIFETINMLRNENKILLIDGKLQVQV